MDYRNQIQEYINLEIDTLKKLDVNAINEALNLIYDTYEKEGTIYVFGNGGSSATASHYQNDFNKGISEYVEKKFRFLCLNDNVPTVMAIANDIGFEEIFRFQLKNKLKKDGRLLELSDVSLNAPVMSMQVTEDIHMIYDHLIMSIFYKTMCNKEHLSK